MAVLSSRGPCSSITTTIFYLKEILSKEIPAEGRRGRSLSDHESPKKTMGAEDVRGRSAEDHVIKKNSPAAAEDARGRCSRKMLAEHAHGIYKLPTSR